MYTTSNTEGFSQFELDEMNMAVRLIVNEKHLQRVSDDGSEHWIIREVEEIVGQVAGIVPIKAETLAIAAMNRKQF